MLAIALEFNDTLPHFSNLRSHLLNHKAKHCSTPAPLAMLVSQIQSHHTKPSYQSYANNRHCWNDNIGFHSITRNYAPGILDGVPSSSQCQLRYHKVLKNRRIRCMILINKS
ncbi:hypothetical protein M0R45_026700 [Rubus argutus]|uniref:Uncharacterized protein n=1 Tax=Rubus argutus TaxID=59490 RepID=A0AAW1X0S1_RUBAR